ncbi:MAG TPA: alpha/beta hydrolase [Actinophytocola sp.]|jgi:pimeloyl-ACP methyl ester carboxylesterase|nr:alpha/beta hydrolase [Actinophytocola sp.]
MQKVPDGTVADELSWLERAAGDAGLDIPDLVLPESRHVVLRGMRFHYLDWGTAGRPPVLFLHGGALNAHTYDLVCAALRGDHHCLSLDQRGHGDSEWSPVVDYDNATHAADIAAFVDHLGLRDLVLVGMSLGGLNAIKYAGTHGERLRALVIIDVGPELRAPGTARIGEFTSSTSGEIDSLDEYIEHAVRFNPRRDPDRLRHSLLHNLRRTPAGKWVWKWDPRGRVKTPEQAREFQARRELLWEDVDRIQCPTLVVHGTDSDVFSERDAHTLVERLPRGGYAAVEDAGHTVQGDNPAGLVRELRTFLNGLAT